MSQMPATLDTNGMRVDESPPRSVPPNLTAEEVTELVPQHVWDAPASTNSEDSFLLTAPENVAPGEEDSFGDAPTPSEIAVDVGDVLLRGSRRSSADRTPTSFESAVIAALSDERSCRDLQTLASNLVAMSPADMAASLSVITVDGRDLSAEVAARTAAVCAQRENHDVLLMDGNLADRVVSKHFRVAGEPGLADVINQRRRWKACIQPTNIAGLCLLPAGRGSVTGCSDIAERIAGLLDELKRHFAFVVVDAGKPDEPAARLLIRKTDATCLTIQLGQTRTEAAAQYVRSLEREGVPLLGCIATSAQT